MKVKVIKVYRDKYTNKLQRINDEIDIDKDRFNEINDHIEGPFLEKIEMSKGKSAKKG